MNASSDNTPDIVTAIEKAGHMLKAIKASVGQSVFGQPEVINNSLITLLAGGHLLLVGVPGLAKTLLVTTLGRVLGAETKRIQCTPDLMPSDIIGTEILEEVDYGKRHFRFVKGPVFCQLFMVDEINRASPRTQSALLQAMQEKCVSVSGREYPLPAPFHVLATQNPLEQEGTYPLPEAQLDRFLMQVNVEYPDLAAERQMLLNPQAIGEENSKSLIYASDLQEMQALVRRMPIGEKVLEGILALVRNGRPETSSLGLVKKYISWGTGPRASQALSLAARARALTDGRISPSMDDVIALITPVLQHRMALTFSARAEGVSVHDVLKELKAFAASV